MYKYQFVYSHFPVPRCTCRRFRFQFQEMDCELLHICLLSFLFKDAMSGSMLLCSAPPCQLQSEDSAYLSYIFSKSTLKKTGVEDSARQLHGVCSILNHSSHCPAFRPASTVSIAYVYDYQKSRAGTPCPSLRMLCPIGLQKCVRNNEHLCQRLYVRHSKHVTDPKCPSSFSACLPSDTPMSIPQRIRRLWVQVITRAKSRCL